MRGIDFANRAPIIVNVVGYRDGTGVMCHADARHRATLTLLLEGPGGLNYAKGTASLADDVHQALHEDEYGMMCLGLCRAPFRTRKSSRDAPDLTSTPSRVW
jgi:hypothetical protein